MGPWLGLLNAYVTAILHILNIMRLKGLNTLTGILASAIHKKQKAVKLHKL